MMVNGISLASELTVLSWDLMTTKQKLRTARTLFSFFQKKKKKLLSLIFFVIQLASCKIAR